jgi:hypothetical protein
MLADNPRNSPISVIFPPTPSGGSCSWLPLGPFDRLRSRGEIMTGMRLSLKTINSELERRGEQAVLTRGDGYFYFLGGEATDWTAPQN